MSSNSNAISSIDGKDKDTMEDDDDEIGLVEHWYSLRDLTPRKLILDSGFISDLRHILGWTSIRDPILADLHSSFGNLDHTGQFINKLRDKLFPNGTSLEGAYQILEKHQTFPIEDHYVRAVEEHEIRGIGKVKFIVCMFPAMSHLLLATKCPSIDTLFKRLHQWQEFEIKAWFDEYNRSIVVARTFTTSQTAEAHKLLFSRIFDIMEQDTGETVCFRYIHAWLKDKQEGSPFTLPALYQPLSKIPLDIWKVFPTTSNGNEQVHHSINHDGVKLTMLAGIMRGMQYDTCAMGALVVLLEYRIHTRDQAATHFRRVLRTVTRSANVQQRTVSSHDDIIRTLCNQVLEQERAIDREQIAANRALEAHTQMEPVLAQLQIEEIRLHELFEELRTAQEKGSGQVEIPQFKYAQQI
ncbi:hypothetical protein M422DRAFT_269218 [Sphaerobolus stellatus SS14]|uniref:Uncharacterized protein n=1 Tax=Sphaerobolus stellatus (strain SS14) TaxID=990650 RepID=A0A0C9UVP5_SPHS4|nr:hypothetical protein M422DRAFT_269218 [Sphaerobolus stellatus SS14]